MTVLLAFVRSHGFRAWPTDDGVRFVIPGVDVRTGEIVSETVTVRSMDEARNELGY